MKHHRFASIKVGRGHAQRNAQLFESLHLQNACQKRNHAVVGSEAAARQRPARKTGEAYAGRHIFKLLQRDAAAVGRANQRAHTGATNHSYGYTFLFENLQNANVRNASRKSAAQRNSDCRVSGRQNWPVLTGELPPKGLDRPNNLPQTIHRKPHVSGAIYLYPNPTASNITQSLDARKGTRVLLRITIGSQNDTVTGYFKIGSR